MMSSKYVYHARSTQVRHLGEGDVCPACDSAKIIKASGELVCQDGTGCGAKFVSYSYELVIRKAIPVAPGDKCPHCLAGSLKARVGAVVCEQCRIMILVYSALPYDLVDIGQTFQIAGNCDPATFVKLPGPPASVFDGVFVILVDELEAA